MKEQFCNYEISLKLKELGFNEYCLTSYKPDKTLFKIWYNESVEGKTICSAPLYQQIIDWFREEYKLHLSIYRLNDNWVWQIFDIERNCYITEMTVRFSEIKRSYEECRDQIILRAIELCQNKK